MNCKRVSIFCLLFAVGLTFSASLNAASCEEIAKSYGSSILLPSSVASFFNGDSVNLFFALDSGSVITVNGKVGPAGIGSIKCGKYKYSDYDITLNQDAAFTLAASKNPTKTFKELMKAGKVKITANGIIQSLKLRLGELMLLSQ